MSLFEFIVGMISVLIALAIVQLLIGLGRLVQARGKVITYLPHTLWNANLFILLFLHWWSLWDFRDIEWNSPRFFFSLMGHTLAFFAATLLSPLPRDDEPVDLEDHYRRICPTFLAVVAASLFFMTLDGPWFGTERLFNGLRVVQLTMFACLITGLALPERRVQIGVAVINSIALAGGVLVRFLPGTYA